MQPFVDIERDRAYGTVGERLAYPEDEFSLLKVRIGTAVTGTAFVNGATIVLKERAGLLIKLPGIVLVKSKKALFEFLDGELQVQGESLDVGLRQTWQHDLAAVSAGGAVDLSRHLLIYFFYCSKNHGHLQQ